MANRKSNNYPTNGHSNATNGHSNGHSNDHSNGTNGYHQTEQVVCPEMCFFCFDVLQKELDQSNERHIEPNFSNDAL